MKIIAIVPAYNEEKSIEKVVKGIKKHIREVIVIDDGSSDSTAAIAKKTGAILLSHPILLPPV